MSYKTREEVQNRVKEHHQKALDLGYEVVGTFLQGSFNYEKNFGDMTDEESDVDTKCLVLPTFEDFCLGRKLVSTTYEMENGEHLDLKDLRLYLNLFKKQNINIVEILFTDYFVLNPKYEEVFKKLMGKKEAIARYDVKATLSCIVGMAYEKQKALSHPYPTLKDKIDKYGFDGKQLSHVFRLNEFMDKYCKGLSYKDCLYTDMGDFLVKIKRNKLFTLSEAQRNMDKLVEIMHDKKEEFLKDYKGEKSIELDKFFEEVAIDCMKINFVSYLKN